MSVPLAASPVPLDLPPLPVLDAVLWALAVVFYGVGDYVTTVAATARPGARERNPVVRRLFAWAPLPPSVSFAVAKLAAFVCFAAGYLAVDASAARASIPAVVAAIGIAVTAQNVRTLAV